MRKYNYVFTTTFKSKRVTLVDTLFSMIGYMVMCYILIQLWKYIYGGSGYGATINNFTMQQMLWYLLVTEFIQCCAKGKRCVQFVGDEVKSGALQYKLNKPYNYYTYSLVYFFSEAMWTFVLYLPFCFLLGGLFIGDYSSVLHVGLLPSIITFVLAVVVVYSVYMVVAMLSFWIEDATPFAWVLQKLGWVCGMLFPIDFLPKAIQPFIYYSPLYSIYSGPAKLIANFDWFSFLTLILSQTFWIVVLNIVGRLIFIKAKRKVNVNGG